MPNNFGPIEENLIDFYNRSYSVGGEKVFTFLAEEIKFVLQRYDFSQWDLNGGAEELGMKCHQRTPEDRDWEFRDRFLKDFRKKIPNASGDAGYINDISAEDFFDCLQNFVSHVSTGNGEGPMLKGAAALYELTVQM